MRHETAVKQKLEIKLYYIEGKASTKPFAGNAIKSYLMCSKSCEMEPVDFHVTSRNIYDSIKRTNPCVQAKK